MDFIKKKETPHSQLESEAWEVLSDYKSEPCISYHTKVYITLARFCRYILETLYLYYYIDIIEKAKKKTLPLALRNSLFESFCVKRKDYHEEPLNCTQI